MTESKQGSLKVVGTGITLSGQMTLYTESVIKSADIVFCVVTDSAFANLQKLNSKVINLRKHYDANTSRVITYRNMKQDIVAAVQAGNNVVAAFYGHPGVFVNPSHEAISEVRAMGLSAQMLPGISAEDCLVADLGMDPAQNGCQSYEATKFLFRKYSLDPYMMQIIWQVGVIADFKCPRDKVEHPGLPILRDALLQYFPREHEVILYEASTIPVAPARIEVFSLQDLAEVKPSMISTLVVPALAKAELDLDTMAKFGLTPELLKKELEENGN